MQISKSAKTISFAIKELQNKGLLIPDWINSSYELVNIHKDKPLLFPKTLQREFPDTFDTINALAESAKRASKHPPLYTHGNFKLSRKKSDFKHSYFITRLHQYTEDLFNKPLHKVIAITTNTLFETDTFNEDNIKMRLSEFKSRR
jgi:hypothetical protein